MRILATAAIFALRVLFLVPYFPAIADAKLVTVDLRSQRNPGRVDEELRAHLVLDRWTKRANALCAKYKFGPTLGRPDYNFDRRAYVIECYPRRYDATSPFGQILVESLLP